MLIDMLLLSAVSWLLAKILNKVFSAENPASKFVAWSLTVGYFLVGVVVASAMKALRYSEISKSIGTSITPQNPLDMVMAFLMAYIFFQFLNQGSKNTPKSNIPTAPQSGFRTTDPISLAQIADPMPELDVDSQHSSIHPMTISHKAENSLPATSPSKPIIGATFVDDDVVYATIADEIESGKPDKGLWTRLFAELDGDEKKTKIAYIKQRAEKLIATEQSRISQETRRRDEENKATVLLVLLTATSPTPTWRGSFVCGVPGNLRCLQ